MIGSQPTKDSLPTTSVLTTPVCQAGNLVSRQAAWTQLEEDVLPADRPSPFCLTDHQRPYFLQAAVDKCTLVTFEPEGFRMLSVESKQITSAGCSCKAGCDQPKSSTDLVFFEDQTTTDCSPEGLARSKSRTFADLGEEKQELEQLSDRSRRSRRSASLEILCKNKSSAMPAGSKELDIVQQLGQQVEAGKSQQAKQHQLNPEELYLPKEAHYPDDILERTPTWGTLTQFGPKVAIRPLSSAVLTSVTPQIVEPLQMSPILCIPESYQQQEHDDEPRSSRKKTGLAILSQLENLPARTKPADCTESVSSASKDTPRGFIITEKANLETHLTQKLQHQHSFEPQTCQTDAQCRDIVCPVPRTADPREPHPTPLQEQPVQAVGPNIFYDTDEQPVSSDARLQAISTRRADSQSGCSSERRQKVSSFRDSASVVSYSSEVDSTIQIRARTTHKPVSSRTEKCLDQGKPQNSIVDQSAICRQVTLCHFSRKQEGRAGPAPFEISMPVKRGESLQAHLPPVPSSPKSPHLLSNSSGKTPDSPQKIMKTRLEGFVNSHHQRSESADYKRPVSTDSTGNRHLLAILLVLLGIGLAASELFWG